MDFERTKNPKESINIGFTEPIKKLIKKIGGTLIPYEDFINFNIKHHFDDKRFCVVINGSEFLLLRSTNKDKFLKGHIKDLYSILVDESTLYDRLTEWEKRSKSKNKYNSDDSGGIYF